jgi:hypothetical protein
MVRRGTAVVTSKAGWKWDDIILDLGTRVLEKVWWK